MGKAALARRLIAEIATRLEARAPMTAVRPRLALKVIDERIRPICPLTRRRDPRDSIYARASTRR
jgi:hypothetical protein